MAYFLNVFRTGPKISPPVKIFPPPHIELNHHLLSFPSRFHSAVHLPSLIASRGLCQAVWGSIEKSVDITAKKCTTGKGFKPALEWRKGQHWPAHSGSRWNLHCHSYSFLRMSLLFRSTFESLRGLPFLWGWRKSSVTSSEDKLSSPSMASLLRFLRIVLNSPA